MSPLALPTFQWNESLAYLSTPVLFWMLISLIVLGILSVSYNPALNAILDAPLSNSIGMKYGNIYASVWKLKLRITDVVLTPSSSAILKHIFLTLFPGGNVMPSKNSVDFPESKIIVGKITIKARFSSLARSLDDLDDGENATGFPTKEEKDGATIQKEFGFMGWFTSLNQFLPRPVIVIILHNVTIHVEKVYLAPKPPPKLMQHAKKTAASATSNDNGDDVDYNSFLPVVIPIPSNDVANNDDDVKDLPTFDQDYFWEMIRDEGSYNAESLTFYIERWIDHAVTKLRKKGRGKEEETSSIHSKADISFSPRNMKVESIDEKVSTTDEKFNSWISFFVKRLCHHITLDLINASVVMSGAGSDYVKKTREKYPPRQANLELAKLPKHRRAVTVFGSDRISLSFSPDSQCNLLGCFVGAYLKVGNPLSLTALMSNSTNPTDSQYSWHQIVDPFQCVAEFKGVIPFLIYSLSYDQYWETRSLELDLLVSEQNLNLSPTHIHTVLLHLETYADFSCPLYQWLEWLRRMRSEVLKLTPEQKVAYCNNYARIKTGTKVDELEDSEDQHLLTPNQLNQMEMAMDEWEILSLRCFAMRKHWLIPKGNKEFTEFLRNTKSSISFKSDMDIGSLTGYVNSPFQRVYPTPLHALLMLVSEKSSILAPQITFTFSAGEYVFDFPPETGEIDSREDTPRKAIPSFFVSSGVRFIFNQSNPVFQRTETFDTKRSSFDLSLEVAGLRWALTVGENDEIINELPHYQSNHPVGIVYEAQKRQNTDSVFSISLGCSISPTIDSEAHFDVSLETSDLVVVVNPLPLVSSFELLLELLSFPSQPQVDSDESLSSEDDIGGSILSTSSNLNVSVRNVSFLFVIDRKRINRGILDFHANKIDMDLNTGGNSGKLTLLAGPFELSAGRVAHYQSHLFNKFGNDASFRETFGGIEYSLMPFKPIMYIEGVEIFASGETEATRKNKSATETSTLVIGLEMNTNQFTINASPSTIVAIRSVISSFDPFLSRMQGNPEEEALKAKKMSEENERKNVEIQRQVMKRIFSEIDTDKSGIISGEEFDQLVVMLWNEARGGFALTEDERQRETKYLVSMVDRSRSKEVTLQDLDDALDMLAGNIDDNNPVSKSKIIGDNFATSDQFLSSSKLRQLIYFEDLREYASMHKVNEIIGEMDIESGDFSFPSPSLWLQGRGVDIFWDFYTKETGCSRSSMKGQDMSAVQRRLVRSLCNYEFARFCWKSIVQPELHSGGSEKTTTQWLLDNNTYTLYRSGVIYLLVDHVSRVAKESIEETQNKASPKSTCEYALSLTATVKSASVKFGSSHEFAKPLLETSLTNMSLNTSALMLGDGTFVETRELGDEDYAESYGNNVLQFQGTMSAKYLNTKHSHMECFLEPYPYFGRATYHAFVPDPSLHPQISKAASPKTWSVKVDCPRFFSINTSPSLFETGSVITEIIGQTDPESHRTFLYQRDIAFIQNFWDANPALQNGRLDRDSVLDVLCNATDTHWQQEFQGMSSDGKRQMLGNFIDMTIGSDIEGLISFDDVKSWFRTITSRCYFTGVEEIQIYNDSGMQLKVTSKSNFDKQRSRYSVMNEANFQVVVNSFQPIRNGNAGAIFMNDKHAIRNSQKKKPVLCGNLSMYLSGFRLLENVAVDPYQTLMFKLKMRKGLYDRSSRRRNARGVSGFQPYLTVVPKSSSLDTITLYVRSNVVIRSEVPVKIRIVRLGKSAGQFSKQGLQKRNKKSIDLTKKYLMTALNRAVEGAPVVFEATCNGEGDVVALPLSVLTSTRFHAILIQDMSGKARNAWRSPLLFTRDFLFNPMNIRDVSRYHTMSGVVIQKERLNVQNAGKRSAKAFAGDPKRNIMRRTAWDVTILVVPFFLCMNTLPFPITIRAWQYAINDEDDDWDGAAAALFVDPEDTNELSSSDDESEMTPSLNNAGINGDLYHLSTIDNSDYYYEGVVKVGQTLRLSGIKLSQPLFIQVSQHLENVGAAASLIWTNPVQMDLQKLQSGMNRKGSRSLPKLILDLGDNCDCLVDVSLDRDSKMPFCTFYSPYWVINKTGMKLEYSVSGANDKRYLDSGAGGLPVCMHCGKSEETNATLDQGSRHLSVIPLECPSEEVMKNWWDEEINGKLVLKRNGILDVTDWPRQPINLVAAGTNGEVHCDCFVLEARVESLAGTFHRSNLIKLTPRFIVKNTLHISISILPFVGGPRDARKMATYLSDDISETEEKKLLTLSPGESTVIYSFQSFYSESDLSYRWVAFRVNARRFGATFKCKWHMIPLNVMHSHYFGEHDGVNDTMCGILEAKVHWSKAGSILTSISHADTPPYRIENRSQTHYLQLVQDDWEADVFELPPMHSCGYTWDSPLGKKRLRVAVIPGRQSARDIDRGGKTSDFDSKSTASTVDSDDDSDNEEQEDALLRSMRKGISTNGSSKTRGKANRQLLQSRLARKYNFQKIGKQKDLPCSRLDDWMSNLNKSGESLSVHTRISTGTKVISFNDSDWLANQIEAGLLRRGGDFEGALIDINIEGVGIYFNDNYPTELMGIVTRDVQICKPHGSIELIARVRHFQIDAMHPNARYPIIIQPLPMGVDRRKAEIDNTSSMAIIPKSIKTRECYWKLKEERPIPLLEMKCSYIPQNKMVWVPNLEVQLCPTKLRVDVEYILRVLSLIFDSVSKYKKGIKSEGIIHVNENLEYQTRGSMDFCLTYIEQFYIHPVVVELEINIKSDDEDFNDEANLDNTSSSLTLTTISQSTNSEWVSGVMGWLINVGANFAHVSPTYTYSSVHYVDTYSDIIELAEDVFDYYWMRTIKQCYKVVFSMHLLGDPSLLLHQWKTGATDLVVKTANEIATGGKDGVGKGVASLFQNVVGGTFFAFGRATGSAADTATAVLTTNLTSDQLKPKSATSNGRNPEQALDGIVRGTEYLAKTVAHGIAGLIGNPYRGMQTGTITGVAKGVSTGVIGVVACPFIGALGFIAKTSTGIGQTTTLLNLGYIEARCRPRRIVPWGMPMSINNLPYLKGIGIRIHSVRYQKVRKRILNDDVDPSDHNDEDDITKRERRRIRTAEKRRLNPPSKVVSIKREKDKFHHLSHPIRPKLLSDHPGNLILSHYAVTYEETIELRSSDLQLDDIVSINFWNYKMLKTTTKAKSLAVCKISVGDMYCHALTFYHEQLKRIEANLAKGVSPTPHGEQQRMSLILPAPQEYPLFRPLKVSKNDRKDIFEAINEEMVAIQKTEEDRIAMFASDSDAESDSSFLNEGKSTDEEIGDLIKKNERLFGSVSLSFFPIPW